MTRYDIVFLDADDTLFDFARAERHSFDKMLNEFGANADDELFNRYSVVNKRYWNLLEQGKINKEEVVIRRFEELITALGLNRPSEELNHCFQKHLSRSAFLLDGALETCKALAPHCKLVIATNGVEHTQKNRLARSEIHAYISHIIVSEEAGAEKPNTRFYDYAFRVCGECPPSRGLMVGDSLSSDIQGGINYGLDTCWYNPKGAEKPVGLPVHYIISHLRELIPLVLQL